MEQTPIAVNGRSQPAIPALTGLRYIAAISVVVFHIAPHSPSPLLAPVMNAINMCGNAAVCFFFCLSGFILVYSDLDASGKMRKSVRDFWRARFARIYPIYLFAFLIAAVPTFWGLRETHGISGTLERMLLYGTAAALLLQSWTPLTSAAWNSPGWSLSAEAFFYAMFPALCNLYRRGRPVWIGLLCACCIVASLPGFILFRFYPVGAPVLVSYFLENNPVFRIPEFIAGMLVGMIRLQMQSNGSLSRTSSSVPAATLLTILTIFALLAHGWWLRTALLLLFLPLILELSRDDSKLAHGLGRPWMVRLGEASYSVYILHVPVWVYVHRMFHIEQTNLPIVIAYIIFITGFSLLTYRYIERPLALRLRSRSNPLPVAA